MCLLFQFCFSLEIIKISNLPNALMRLGMFKMAAVLPYLLVKRCSTGALIHTCTAVPHCDAFEE